MKIEIELEYIEQLKEEIKEKGYQVTVLSQKLAELDNKKLHDEAVKLSLTLFDQYMFSVFEKIGFDKWEKGKCGVIFQDSLAHWIGKSWWNSDQLTVNIEAHISNQFRKAFLNLGIKPLREKKDEPIE